MDDSLTMNSFQVVHVNRGSGAYSSSNLLSIRDVIQGCQSLALFVISREGQSLMTHWRGRNREASALSLVGTHWLKLPSWWRGLTALVSQVSPFP
eukprot:1156642-Pelagomonas_calceolata.AAC.2